ncbi:hypothetical protein D3C80_2179260 [compost metagenome]
MRQDQLDEQVRVTDGKVELHEGRVRLAAYADIARHLLEGSGGLGHAQVLRLDVPRARATAVPGALKSLKITTK